MRYLVLSVTALLLLASDHCQAQPPNTTSPPQVLTANTGSGLATFGQAGFSGGWYYRSQGQLLIIGITDHAQYDPIKKAYFTVSKGWQMNVYIGTSSPQFVGTYVSGAWDGLSPATFSLSVGKGPATILVT